MWLVIFQEPQPSTFCKVFSAWESVTYNFGLFSKYLSYSSIGADSFRSLEFIAIMAGRQVLRQLSRAPPFSSTNTRLACVCECCVWKDGKEEKRGYTPETSKPNPSGIPLPARPYFLILPKEFYYQKPSIHIYEPTGIISMEMGNPSDCGVCSHYSPFSGVLAWLSNCSVD